jgi:hypothetical protein
MLIATQLGATVATLVMGSEAAGLDALVTVERARAAALAVGHATTDELDQ